MKQNHQSYVSNGLIRRIEMVGTCEPYAFDKVTQQIVSEHDDWIIEPLLSGYRTVIHYCPETGKLSFFKGSGDVCIDWGKGNPNVFWESEDNKTFSIHEVVLDSVKIDETYHVFDCLFYNSWLLKKPLTTRKKICKKIIQTANDSRFVFVKPLAGNIPKERIIYKRKKSRYIAGFSYDWIARPYEDPIPGPHIPVSE